MAGEEAKSSSSGGGGGDAFYTDVLFWILFALVLWYVIKYLANLVGLSFSILPSLTSIFSAVFGGIQIFSIFLCLVFALGIIYTKFKQAQLLHHHHDDHGHGHDNHHAHNATSHSSAHGPKDAHAPHASNKRWETILARMDSSHESDWRLAIIECDILLHEMLIKMGYRGESIADKLKQVEPSDFHTIEDAWEAHKTRNRIAHSGSEYHLSRSEVEATFKQYKRVFEEFYFV